MQERKREERGGFGGGFALLEFLRKGKSRVGIEFLRNDGAHHLFVLSTSLNLSENNIHKLLATCPCLFKHVHSMFTTCSLLVQTLLDDAVACS